MKNVIYCHLKFYDRLGQVSPEQSWVVAFNINAMQTKLIWLVTWLCEFRAWKQDPILSTSGWASTAEETSCSPPFLLKSVLLVRISASAIANHDVMLQWGIGTRREKKADCEHYKTNPSPSLADLLRGFVTRKRDEPLRTSAGEANKPSVSPETE